MSMVALIDKLISERGFSDEMLVNLTAMIDKDIAFTGSRVATLQDEIDRLDRQAADLGRRKEEIITEFAKRRASLTALIGEEGATT